MIFEMKTLNSRKCDNLACILHHVASKVWHLSSEAEFTVVTMCRINAMKNAMSNCYLLQIGNAALRAELGRRCSKTRSKIAKKQNDVIARW